MWLDFADAMAALREERGKGIRIAIVDSGIETSHPDLAGMKLRDDVHIIEDGISVSAKQGDGSDLCGHGTAIASIIYRTAPEAEIGSFRVLDAANLSKTDIIREGVRQALDRGYHVLNCSFGCGLPDHVLKYKSWVDESYIKGVHIVAACNNEDYTRPEWPGYFPSVVTVNFGQINDESLYYRAGHLVEFFAPGADVEAAWKGGRRKKLCGSSFAAPHAAALLARILSRYPSLPPLQAKALLHELARPWSEEVAGDNVHDVRPPQPVAPAAPRMGKRPPGVPFPPAPPTANP